MPRRQRRRAWGSVTEISRGRKYVIRWVENTPAGRKRKSKTVYGTYREACMELDRLHVEKAADRPEPTFGEICEMWYIPWLEGRVRDGKTKHGTLEQYMRILEKTVLPTWGKCPVGSIRPIDIQAWLSGMHKTEASLSIVVARAAMDFPVKYELVESNKFRQRFEMPSKDAFTKRTDTYSLEKADEVFHALHGSMCEPSFILACFGSARIGESLGVLRSEVRHMRCMGIDFAVVPIKRRVPRKGSDVGPDGDLKTPSSVRTLVIPEPYGTRLLEISERGIVDGSPWLSPQHNGATMSCGMLGWYWRKASGSDHIPFKNLRTSWRTFAQFEWGVDYDTCEVLMGHKLPGVTGSHYLRPTDEQLVKKVAESLSTWDK